MPEAFVRLVSDNGDVVLMAAPATEAEEEVGFGLPKTMRVSDLAESVKPVLESLRSRLAQINPDELTLTATIGVAIESGVALSLIASGNADFGIEVTMTWTRQG